MLPCHQILTHPQQNTVGSSQRRGWLYRMLRSSSNQATIPQTPGLQAVQHTRSVSDLALHLIHRQNDSPKTIELQEMMRLSGRSLLYLPVGYAPSALMLPSGLRATAHYIAQHITTRGLFRIPGSVRVVDDLFDYYCSTENGEDVTNTVRCANLPLHISASEHDVASAFKRMLYVLPGGILGSLPLFDTLVTIHSRFRSEPEFPRTKHTMVRARLIALAIVTINSSARRDLICAVFGLLNLIGRVAEVAPREDEDGKPLPTGELMGYNGLGIVFGPLLVGDLLERSTIKSAVSIPESLSSPVNLPEIERNCRKSKGPTAQNPEPALIDKILLANSIAEMIITNWRDVVRQIKSLNIYQRNLMPSSTTIRNEQTIHPGSSSFVIKKPQEWDQAWISSQDQETESHRRKNVESRSPTLSVQKHRLRRTKSWISKQTANNPSTTEEGGAPPEKNKLEGIYSHSAIPSKPTNQVEDALQTLVAELQKPGAALPFPQTGRRSSAVVPSRPRRDSVEPIKDPLSLNQKKREKSLSSPRVSLESVPPRTSSRFKTTSEAPRTTRTHSREGSSTYAPRSLVTPETQIKRSRKSHGIKKPKKLQNMCAFEGSKSPADQEMVLEVQQSPSTPTEYSPPRKASVAATDISEGDFEQLGFLLSQIGPPRKSESSIDTVLEGPSNAGHRRPSDISVARMSQDSEYFYLTSSTAMQRQKTDRSPDSDVEASFESTPRQFYAPMTVAPNISCPDVPKQGERPSEVYVDT